MLKYLRGLVLPWWTSYALAVAIAGGTYWFIDHNARVEERIIVSAKFEADKEASRKATEKRLAEQASANAAAIAVLNTAHAAELATRDARANALEAAWEAEKWKPVVSKTCSNVFWPKAVVKELRR